MRTAVELPSPVEGAGNNAPSSFLLSSAPAPWATMDVQLDTLGGQQSMLNSSKGSNSTGIGKATTPA